MLTCLSPVILSYQDGRQTNFLHKHETTCTKFFNYHAIAMLPSHQPSVFPFLCLSLPFSLIPFFYLLLLIPIAFIHSLYDKMTFAANVNVCIITFTLNIVASAHPHDK